MKNADKIIWSGNTLDELRRLLGGEPEIDFADFPTSGLEYPWPITVKQVISTMTEKGPVVDVVLEFDEIPDAGEYQIRNSLLPEADGKIHQWVGRTSQIMKIDPLVTDNSFLTRSYLDPGPDPTHSGGGLPSAVMLTAYATGPSADVSYTGVQFSVYRSELPGTYWWIHTGGALNNQDNWVNIGAATGFGYNDSGGYVYTLFINGYFAVGGAGPYEAQGWTFDPIKGIGYIGGAYVNYGDVSAYIAPYQPKITVALTGLAEGPVYVEEVTIAPTPGVG